MTASFAITAAGVTVTLESFQWGYVEGVAYGERNVQTTEMGEYYRDRTGVAQRYMKVRFIGLDEKIEAFRNLSIIAGRKGLPVVFTPDTDTPGTNWLVDWPNQETITRALENRQEVEIPLLEQSPGL